MKLQHICNTVELRLSEAQSTGLPVIQIDVAIVLRAYGLQKTLLDFLCSTGNNFNAVNQRFILFDTFLRHNFLFLFELLYLSHQIIKLFITRITGIPN
jgi:hypothetical protein